MRMCRYLSKTKTVNVFVYAKKQTTVDKNVLCTVALVIVTCISNFKLKSRTIKKLLTINESFTLPSVAVV